jgi:hypothetical protein
MSSWLPESHRLQLALTALASGCIAATAVIGLQNAKQWYSIHDLKGSIPDLGSKHDVEKVTIHPTQQQKIYLTTLPDQRLRRRLPIRNAPKQRRRTRHRPRPPRPPRRLRRSTNPRATRPQPRLPHRRRPIQTAQRLRHRRRLRRRRLPRSSRPGAFRLWQNPPHRLRPSHPQLAEPPRRSHARRRRDAEGSLPAAPVGADRAVDAIRCS